MEPEMTHFYCNAGVGLKGRGHEMGEVPIAPMWKTKRNIWVYNAKNYVRKDLLFIQTSEMIIYRWMEHCDVTKPGFFLDPF